MSMTDGTDVADLLAERPELEPAVREALAADDRADGAGWTFDDLGVDSGAFGELVSRGVVEKAGDGYRVADRTAVRAALDGETVAEDATAEGPSFPTAPALPSVDRRALGALLGALAVVVLFRAYNVGSVFRGADVVLSGNDPYHYRYLVEQLLHTANGPFDFSILSNLPGGVAGGEPMVVVAAWWFAALFGGSAAAAGWVLAWYPVVAAVIVAVLTYATAVVVTDDRRIGLAAVLLLAVTPGHAMRTSLGFADHHPFDYIWLALTAYALAVLLVERGGELARDRKSWLAAGALGVGLAGQTLSWDAGPLLVVPVGLTVALAAILDVRADRSPLRASAPLASGIALGAVLTTLVHSALGWQSGTVASAPLLVLAGTVGVLALAAIFHRLGLSARALAAVEVVGAVAAVLFVQTVTPEYWADLQSGIGRLTRHTGIAEMASLLDGQTLGWLLLFGFVLVLAVPYLLWASVRIYRGDDEWLVPGVYGWYFLALAMFQVRFVGELAPFTAIFAGLGFVHLANVVDVARPPLPFGTDGAPATDGGRRSFEVPTPRAAGALFALFLLVGGLGMVQAPVKISQIAVEDQTYQTAAWISDDAAAANLSYPDDYVFSSWGRNRVYNYFVNGHSDSYGYAKSNYASFVSAVNGSQWYEKLHGRTGYVVTQDVDGFSKRTLQTRLHQHYGSASGSVPGTGHYRAVYATPDGSRKTFRLVPGATIVGDVAANETVTVAANVSIPNAAFTYERHATATDGRFRVRVAYPGKYRVGNRTVTVTAADVRQGTTVDASADRNR